MGLFGGGNDPQRPGRTWIRRMRQWFGDNRLDWNENVQQRAQVQAERINKFIAQRNQQKAELIQQQQQAQGQGGQGQGGQ